MNCKWETLYTEPRSIEIVVEKLHGTPLWDLLWESVFDLTVDDAGEYIADVVELEKALGSLANQATQEEF